MPVKDLPLFGSFNVQRFTQFNPEDCANWYLLQDDNAKRSIAFYPAMGRRHINILNINRLIFPATPRNHYVSINYYYVFVANQVYRYDKNFNRITLSPPDMTTLSGSIYFTFLVAPTYTLACFTDGHNMWVHDENTSNTVKVTDPFLPKNPTALAGFGNRIVISGSNSSQMVLSKVNLGGLSGDNINPATCFFGGGTSVFAFDDGPIINYGVLHNTLYIFQDYTTSVWSNIPSIFTNADGSISSFPWKKNTTFNFNYGLASPFSLDIGFGIMVWLGRNKNGLVQIVSTDGRQPQPISTKAVDILLRGDTVNSTLSPLLSLNANGFLYQFENTVFYRLSAGKFLDLGTFDLQNTANSIEYNFDTKTWIRCIEVNGERNRINQHVFFSNRHLVTLQDDTTVYEMSGQFYTNEVTNPDQTKQNAPDYYIKDPMRYERVTPIITEKDLGEFITDWVQIDFVWGDQTFINSTAPFENTVYIVDEDGKYVVSDSDPNTYVIAEKSNFPELNSKIYHDWFKPQVELYYSDDGGISYQTADVREFSQLGVYNWRMRWYQLGVSRNRVYKLICVSPAPIVVLGALMNVRRASGGAS